MRDEGWGARGEGTGSSGKNSSSALCLGSFHSPSTTKKSRKRRSRGKCLSFVAWALAPGPPMVEKRAKALLRVCSCLGPGEHWHHAAERLSFAALLFDQQAALLGGFGAGSSVHGILLGQKSERLLSRLVGRSSRGLLANVAWGG